MTVPCRGGRHPSRVPPSPPSSPPAWSTGPLPPDVPSCFGVGPSTLLPFLLSCQEALCSPPLNLGFLEIKRPWLRPPYRCCRHTITSESHGEPAGLRSVAPGESDSHRWFINPPDLSEQTAGASVQKQHSEPKARPHSASFDGPILSLPHSVLPGDSTSPGGLEPGLEARGTEDQGLHSLVPAGGSSAAAHGLALRPSSGVGVGGRCSHRTEGMARCGAGPPHWVRVYTRGQGRGGQRGAGTLPSLSASPVKWTNVKTR